MIYDQSSPGFGNSVALPSGNPGVPVAIAMNSRDNFEIDKTPGLSEAGETANPLEGIADFKNDLSRLYVSMKTSGDENFGLGFTYSGQVSDVPYIIAKSNEIRLVGRGSVRAKSEGGAELDLMSTGEAALVGERVFLGAPDSTHTGTTVDTTEGSPAHQHVVRGDDLIIAINNFCNALITSLGPTALVGNLGAPLASSVAIEDACNDFKADALASLSDIVHTE